MIKVTQFKTGWNLGVDVLGKGNGRIFDSYTDNKILSTMQGIGNKVLTPIQNISNNDYTALTDALFTHNGMKVVFPNLWSDSNYTKSVNLNFEFVSPYGDPLSIFKYVYVPFLSLLALSLPRQASDNAYVNPSFVRVDIPGFVTSDFAIISNISWTKGGDSDSWTVDRLPRSITVNVTIEDLYLYMAMTKRLSYLPSNPNYSIFLDTFSGFRAKDITSGSFSANQSYWEGLINRLNVSTNENKVWNKTKFDKMISDSSWLKYEQEKVKNNKRDIHWIKDEN